MKTFLVADTHWGHSNILNFLKKDGTHLRPGFADIKEHDQHLIDRWNSVVSPGDKVYHLGDVGFTSFTHVKNIFDALNGTKVLIKGNHDNFKLSQYAQIFKDVRAYHVLDKFILSHIPIHPESLARWRANIHGHLHDNVHDDPRYINVSVERLDNYTPIEFQKIRDQFQ